MSGPQGYKKVLAGQPGELGEVLCVGKDDHGVRFRSIKAVIGHEDEELFEVTTQYGRSLRVTGNHSFYMLGDGEMRKKRGDNSRSATASSRPAQIRLPETRRSGSICCASCGAPRCCSPGMGPRARAWRRGAAGRCAGNTPETAR